MTLATAARAGAARPASGSFTATVDFTTLTLTPEGSTCRLAAEGVLEFVGTLEGTATGTTTARVLAPCGEVATNPGDRALFAAGVSMMVDADRDGPSLRATHRVSARPVHRGERTGVRLGASPARKPVSRR